MTNTRTPFRAIRITDSVYWVGAIDWNIRDFHGYSTPRGTTYNAFLITGKKNILVDTVKAPFRDELLARIASVIDPTSIDVIISNHAEMDHSGCIFELAALLKPEAIYASEVGAKALKDHFHSPIPVTSVANRSELIIGDKSFRFSETRFLHWPDSMFTYLENDRILFAQDAFGMHYATGQRYFDEIDQNIGCQEQAKYYANIVMPYAPVVLKTLNSLPTHDWKIDILAPDHGPLYRGKSICEVMQHYQNWATGIKRKKAVIAFDTMWNSTETMARVIADALTNSGIDVRVMSLKSSHRSDVATEILEAGALILGSPNLNTGLYPSVADLLCYLKGLRPRNLVGGVFGSFGWNGNIVFQQLRAAFSEMELEVVGEDCKSRFVPENETLELCYKLGESIAERLTR